jgi:hypothetical protein
MLSFYVRDILKALITSIPAATKFPVHSLPHMKPVMRVTFMNPANQLQE